MRWRTSLSQACGSTPFSLRHLGLGVFAAMNAQLVLLSAAAFAACHAFLRRGFQLPVAACCAGAYFFAFGWPRFAQLVHEQLQFTAPLPLMALCALRVFRDGPQLGRRQAFGYLAALALMTVMLLANTPYFALFFALGLTIALGLAACTREGRRGLAVVAVRHTVPIGIGGPAVCRRVGPTCRGLSSRDP